jgi:hypothetical protein
MRKVITIIVYGLSLSIIEYFILLICFLMEGFILYSVPKEIIKGAFREAAEVSLMRFIFYFIFWVITMSIFHYKINIKSPILKLAVLNFGFYILFSVVLSLFFPFAKEYYTSTFFYFLLIATFLSPIILNFIPYFNKTLLDF